MTSLTRRFALALGLSMALALPALTGPARAASPDAARALIEDTANRMIAIVSAPGDIAGKAPQLRALLTEAANLPQIARFAIGPHARGASEQFMDEYTRVFADYLTSSFIGRFEGYSGETLDITAVEDLGRKGIDVVTRINRSGGAEPVFARWRVSDRGGKLQIIDVYVEGTSMALTQRSEFVEMIARNRNSLDAFLLSLKEITYR